MMEKAILIGIGLAGFASVLLGQTVVIASESSETYSFGCNASVASGIVPNLIGMDFEDALLKWGNSGFCGPMIVDRYGDGLVCVAQTIVPGAWARSNTAIGLYMRPR